MAGPTSDAQRPQMSSTLITALALLCTMLWAGAQIGVKVGLASAPPLALLAIRFCIASALLLPVCVIVKSAFPRNASSWWRLAALGVLNNTMYLGLTAMGLDHISGGLACVLTGINPLALALGGWLFFSEKLLPSDVVGLLGALFGIVWVMLGRLGHDNTLGGALTVLAANGVMVAGNLLYKRWNKESGLLVSHMVQLGVGGLTLAALSYVFEPAGSVHFDARFWGAQAFLIFGVSFGAMLIWLFLLGHASAAKAGAYLFLVPIFGLLQGAALLGERLSWSDCLGAAATTGFVWLAQRGRGVAERRAETRGPSLAGAQASQTS